MPDPNRHSDLDADVAIVGAGPAGRWLASRLVRRDVSVAVVDPQLSNQWPNTYGLWLDEVDDLIAGDFFDHTFDEVFVHADGPKTLKRTYGRLHNEKFRRSLDEILTAGEATCIETAARGIENGHNGPILHCDDGRRIHTRLAVDASGAGGVLIEPEAPPRPGFQRAYGMVARFEGDPLGGQSMVLMDFRPWADDENEPSDQPPSFLYGMDLGGDRYFVEETVLVAPWTISFENLRHRLYRRLQKRGVSPAGPIDDTELCHIPMGTPLFRPRPGVTAFGACAGLVHPATGYQMGRMLRAGPPLADAIADGLRRAQDSVALSKLAFEALWPPRLRRARQLLLLGRDMLTGFGRRRLSRFFNAFFSLPDADWRGYLCGDTGHVELSQVMWRLFRRADGSLRWALMQSALADSGRVFDAWRPGQDTFSTRARGFSTGRER